MPWYHNETKEELICISEKHSRNEIIDLLKINQNCEKCWRKCYFWRHHDGTVTIRFQAQKGREDYHE